MLKVISEPIYVKYTMVNKIGIEVDIYVKVFVVATIIDYGRCYVEYMVNGNNEKYYYNGGPKSLYHGYLTEVNPIHDIYKIVCFLLFGLINPIYDKNKQKIHVNPDRKQMFNYLIPLLRFFNWTSGQNIRRDEKSEQYSDPNTIPDTKGTHDFLYKESLENFTPLYQRQDQMNNRYKNRDMLSSYIKYIQKTFPREWRNIVIENITDVPVDDNNVKRVLNCDNLGCKDYFNVDSMLTTGDWYTMDTLV